MSRRTGRYAELLEAARQAAEEVEGRPIDVEARIERVLSRLEEDPQYLLGKIVREPRNVVLEMTLRCNMRCRHCGSAAGKARPDELSLEEWLALVDELTELGARVVTLLGGEPLISEHWEPVARRLADNGVWVNAITNGWTLHLPQVADRVASSALRSLGLSIDGEPREHDDLRQRPGSFSRIEQGIALLQERGFEELSAITCVTRANIPQLPWLHRYLTDHGIKRWRLQICVPEGRMCHSDPVVLQPSDLPALVEFMREYHDKSALSVGAADNVGYFGGCESVTRLRGGRQRFWTGCSAGLQTLGITSDGGVLGCLSFPAQAPWLEGNIRARPLREIWADPDAFAYNRRFSRAQLSGGCAECRYALLCRGGCLSSNIGYTGSIGENPYCLELVQQKETRE
jgi:radical SAM protein with 4Fe4S-binding SPASM domain